MRKTTKRISLLLAPTCIISAIPVFAAEEFQTLEVKDGTIINAVSKGDAKFIIDGYKDGGESSVNYVVDGRYTKLDVDSGDSIGDIYLDKYLRINANNKDEYYVDLTTGQRTDEYDEIINQDTLGRRSAKTLRKKIQEDNEGRFTSNTYVDNLILPDKSVRHDGGTLMFGFSGKWAQYWYDLKTPSIPTNIGGETKSLIYTDTEGNYIDSCYNLGKITAYTTSASVVIKNTEDTYEIEMDGETYELKAQIKNVEEVDEGIDSILRKADLTLYGKRKGELDSEYKPMTSQLEFGTPKEHNKVTNGDSVRVLQKISKEQSSDDVGGIKYSKKVINYFLTDSEGNPKSLLCFTQPMQQVEELNSDITFDPTQGDVTPMILNDGGFLSIFFDKDEQKLYVENVKLKSKNGYYYTDASDYESTDAKAWAICRGDLYCIGNRYIKKWNNIDKFENVYKIDGSMSNISINDPDNLIIWDKDAEGYSILSKKEQVQEQSNTTTTGAQVKVELQNGWLNNGNGTWSYINKDGTKAVGWIEDQEKWYYLKEDGVMATGWINYNGTWYYCNSSGAMLANTTVDGYELGSNGMWIK